MGVALVAGEQGQHRRAENVAFLRRVGARVAQRTIGDESVEQPARLEEVDEERQLPEQVSNHPDHGGKTVAQAVKETEGKAGAPIAVKGFKRYALGEGIEKTTGDFAAEVAAAAKG